MSAEKCDVVVVGAGLSGLSAAQLLKKRNEKLKVLVLEAKGRVGGRTLVQQLPAAHGFDTWDMGGQWVGSSQTHVMELIKELGLEVYPQFTEGKKVHHMGGANAKISTYTSSIPSFSPLVLLDFVQFLWRIEGLCKTVSVEDPMKTPNAQQLDSMTVQSYMDRHIWTRGLSCGMGKKCCSPAVQPEEPHTASMYCRDISTVESNVDVKLTEELCLCSRTVFGMEPSQLSFLYFLMYSAAAGGVMRLLETTPGSAQEFKVKGGAQQLSERLVEQLGKNNVRLDSAVTAIWQSEDGVEVKTAASTVTCKAVIVTCPPHMAGLLMLRATDGANCFKRGKIVLVAVGCQLKDTQIPVPCVFKADAEKSVHMQSSLVWAQIQYHPALPLERQRLAQFMPVGHMTKFIITYPTAFWKQKGFSGEIVARPSEDCPFGVTFDATTPRGSPALVGFIAGEQACYWNSREVITQKRELVFHSPNTRMGCCFVMLVDAVAFLSPEWRRSMEVRRDAVVARLVKYLGPEAASYVHYEEKLLMRVWIVAEDFSASVSLYALFPHRTSTEQDWAKEEYSGGCPVNVMVPGMLTYYHPGLRKPCGRIHWAGTETATQWCGYLSGAIQAGHRAALEVLAEAALEYQETLDSEQFPQAFFGKSN
ncbi:hypothetical protein NFI96_017831, partial [Prochilodus magdalenae]